MATYDDAKPAADQDRKKGNEYDLSVNLIWRSLMKAEIQKIIGKTIKGVVVAEGFRGPQSQLFLIFTDNTFYEIYSLR